LPNLRPIGVIIEEVLAPAMGEAAMRLLRMPMNLLHWKMRRGRHSCKRWSTIVVVDYHRRVHGSMPFMMEWIW